MDGMSSGDACRITTEAYRKCLRVLFDQVARHEVQRGRKQQHKCSNNDVPALSTCKIVAKAISWVLLRLLPSSFIIFCRAVILFFSWRKISKPNVDILARRSSQSDHRRIFRWRVISEGYSTSDFDKWSLQKGSGPSWQVPAGSV